MSLHSTNPDLQLAATRDLDGTRWGKNNKVAGTGSLTQQQLAVDGDHRKERIKKLFEKSELSASAYDTAWVAMVPSPAVSPEKPIFPGCLTWILENQHDDGSWGLHSVHGGGDPTLMKDALSSTLACILALKRWGTGDNHVHSALAFMERNSGSLADSSQQAPIGFDVVFPSMVQTLTRDFRLNLPLDAAQIDAMIRNNRDVALTGVDRSNGRDAYLAYILEGIGSSHQARGNAMRFQRKNGSILNSPSATAAAVIHGHDDALSLGYLRSVLRTTTAVPAVHPLEIQARLCLIDTVESLGIDRHFREEIELALDEIHRRWRQGEEEIFLDATTCAMAFRMLRLNGYPVSSDVFDRFTEVRFWSDTLEGYLKDERAVLELHKAARITCLHDGEASILGRQQLWTAQFLKQLALDHHHCRDVNDVLRYPFHADLDILVHKRNAERYCPDNTRILKSSFSCAAFGGQDFQKLAVQDFNSRQSLHRKELQHLMQWLKEKKLDDTTLAKVKTRYCHFHGSTTFTEPELSHARILLCKHAVLVCVVDAVFDIDGTHEEQLNIVDLLQRWDVNGPKAEFCSKRVETIYWAIHGAICETVEKAFPTQGRSVMDHVVELWVEIVKGMLQEAEWCRTSTIPTLEEYMATSSITLGVAAFLLPAIYSAGHKLEDDVVRGPQYQRLFLLTTTIGRLLNDVRGFEREAQEGNVNAVSLRIMRRGMDMEEAVEEVENLITTLTRQMVRLTTGEDNCGEVPKAVRLMFWRAVKGFFFFYMKEDLYHASTKLVKVVESVMNEPITIA
ncbi:unnamed protein product [Linum tenue]|uniref:Uncharacterized protein n=1 Tax=Linum tenue TaxID=586396 RepID=A0AAV0RM98_9ROSI|nr:unnamed protein product [Linum tenue]